MEKLRLAIYQLLIFLVLLMLGELVLSENLKSKNIFPKEAIDLYEKYLPYVHHLRGFEDYLRVHENPTKLLFSTYGAYETNHINEKIKTVLLQGDSWFNFDHIPEATETLKDLSKSRNFRIISGGTASYAPTLMHKQFDILTKDFRVSPEIVVIYVDQTDLGDENCRYKPLYFSSSSGWGVSPEPFESTEVFEMKFFLAQQKVLNSSSLAIGKYYDLAQLRMERYVFKKNKSNDHRCPFSKISAFLEKLDTSAIDYFERRLNTYLSAVLSFPTVKVVKVVTHNHRRHISPDKFGGKYQVNVSTSVVKVIKGLHVPRGKNILFSNIISKDQVDFIDNDAGSHLKKEKYPEFILNIFNGLG